MRPLSASSNGQPEDAGDMLARVCAIRPSQSPSCSADLAVKIGCSPKFQRLGMGPGMRCEDQQLCRCQAGFGQGSPAVPRFLPRGAGGFLAACKRGSDGGDGVTGAHFLLGAKPGGVAGGDGRLQQANADTVACRSLGSGPSPIEERHGGGNAGRYWYQAGRRVSTWPQNAPM